MKTCIETVFRTYSFPVELTGKSVLIYGASSTGQSICRYLIEQGYNVAGVSDTYIDSYRENFDVPCLYRYQISDLDFDYCVPGATTYRTINIMRDMLVSDGMDPEKFVVPTVRFVCNGKIYDTIDDEETFLRTLIELHNSCRGDAYACTELTDFMRWYASSLSDQDALINRMRNELHNPKTVTSGVLSALFLTDYLRPDGLYVDDKDVKAFIRAVHNLPDDQVDWMVYLVRKISLLGYVNPEVYYSGMGEDVRRLWIKILNIVYEGRLNEADLISGHSYESEVIYPADTGITASITKAPNSVLIIVSQLHDKNDSSSIMMRLVSDALVRAGKRVKIITATDDIPYDYGCYSVEIFATYRYILYSMSLNNLLMNKNVYIEHIHSKSFSTLIKKVVKSAYEFRPGLIIDGTDELLPVSGILIRDFPVLEMAYRACPPGIWFNRTTQKVEPYNNEISGYTVDFPRTPLVTVPFHNYRRKEVLSAENEDFVIVTVGNRIGAEISELLLESMGNFLVKRENALWVLVGDSEKIVELIGNSILRDSKQLRIIEYEDDLPALYQICDVYLNPLRHGGGFSIGIAMANSLPVIALKSGDTAATRWIEESELVEGNERELVECIDKLYLDRGLLKIRGKVAREQYARIDDSDKFEKGICSIVDDIIKNN